MMPPAKPVNEVVDLLDPRGNVLLNHTQQQAAEAVGSGQTERIRQIQGQFAICQPVGTTVRMARSIARPMRYYLSPHAAGPRLIVAERIDEIYQHLASHGLHEPFQPAATRMVPAHHLLEISLVSGSDALPQLSRFFTPQTNCLPADIDAIGRHYIQQLQSACHAWLDNISPHEPIGVLFSGGVDSGSVLLLLHHLLQQRGERPERLKAFTLAVAGQGQDLQQARQFLQAVGLEAFWEVIEVPVSAIDYREAIRVIEDYKPLDVQSATMALAMCREIRRRYPDWKYLIDGDGGDENLKDYPIEDSPPLTIRNVLGNRLLYQEGWGVDAVKHSLVYSGGQSRGHVRTSAPARLLGFEGFSPYALPDVIEVAEAIPFVDLTGWDPQRLYPLKGQVVAAGIRAVTGIEMPRFEKRRFQKGVVDESTFAERFPADPQVYRDTFAELTPSGNR
ncbi:asparagine synthase-related protein [Roseimaritima ulvae]|uniref:Asparagine synthetase B n=1 Tax=Roseimaritima ulvae TaxID=980254 RepID=A0A5B9QS43_9BACT|nr:asparagine synthase-related protein [Roseimaritima ulvae]QEG41868.1 asparagine synthetase B [Roseimaritima ulvae]